jgi:hypothetical protein
VFVPPDDAVSDPRNTVCSQARSGSRGPAPGGAAWTHTRRTITPHEARGTGIAPHPVTARARRGAAARRAPTSPRRYSWPGSPCSSSRRRTRRTCAKHRRSHAGAGSSGSRQPTQHGGSPGTTASRTPRSRIPSRPSAPSTRPRTSRCSSPGPWWLYRRSRPSTPRSHHADASRTALDIHLAGVVTPYVVC